MQKPEPNEYAQYYQRYIDTIVSDDILKYFQLQIEEIISFFKNVNEELASFRYAEGKWMMKEVLAHIIDSERIFGYRALAISRGEKNSLPGYDDKKYISNGKYQNRSLESLITEYYHASSANLELFRSLDEEMLSQRGIASGNEITVRGLVFITVGHEKHHFEIIKTRYIAQG